LLNDIKNRIEATYRCISTGRDVAPLHLLGPTGIGKSSIVRQWAEEKATFMKKKFIDFSMLKIEDIDRILQNPSNFFIFVDVRITSLDPVDLQGLLRERCSVGSQSSYVVYKPLAMAVLMNACAGVLFLDEFLNESRPHMQAATYRIVRDRKLGDTALNHDVLVIAASNELEYSSLSNALPTPLRDRFDWISVDPPSLEEWSKWMDNQFGGRWDRRVLYYLKARPGEFLANVRESNDDNGISPPATPRGWTHVAL
jgi:MoxR-like ATPase